MFVLSLFDFCVMSFIISGFSEIFGEIQMKNTKIALVALLLFVSTTLVYAQSSAMSTPYLCSTCGNGLLSEPEFVHHLLTIHDKDMQIEGEIPDYQLSTRNSREYVPGPYYVDPETGTTFYSEPELVHWLDNQ